MFTYLRKAAVLIVLAVMLAGGYLLQLQWRDNFHPIVSGEAYRSAQPSPEDLKTWVAEAGIRSVINLRGPHEGKGWYDDEVRAAEAMGLAHFDFAMSEGKVLDADRAAQLTTLLRKAPKPVLIHCRAGADRTGLAAALYLADHGASEAEAERHLSFWYGHISIPGTAAWPMDVSWEGLESIVLLPGPM